MREVRTLAVALCCLAIASPLRAATLDDLERQIRDVVTERQASQKERGRLVAEAAALADAISAAQRRTQARADAALQRQLRDFDRLARQLDAVDRALKNHDTTITRLRLVFDAEIDKQTKALSRADASTSAARASELEAARRRVDDLTGPTAGFRPLLVVRPMATDTVADLDQKLAVLAAELARGTNALKALDRDLSVLDGRGIVTRRLLDDLEATARAAPQDLRLVQRQVDEVQQRLRDLELQRIALRRVREAIVSGLADVDLQGRACRARRGTLAGPG
ncbi:MAG: hypothetical protein ABI603_00250 [Acidobacteriota bacterium]